MIFSYPFRHMKITDEGSSLLLKFLVDEQSMEINRADLLILETENVTLSWLANHILE